MTYGCLGSTVLEIVPAETRKGHRIFELALGKLLRERYKSMRVSFRLGLWVKLGITFDRALCKN